LSIVNKNLYDQTVKEIQDEFTEIARRTNKSSNMLAKDYMQAQQRYIKMLGQMGTIKVGAHTELEKHCLKDSVDDAVLACRSAFNNGYIRGLNLTTIKTIDDIIRQRKILFDTHPVVKEDVGNRLELEILELFKDVFVEMSLMVLQNKYPDKYEHIVDRSTVGVNEYDLTVEQRYDVYIEELDKNILMTNSELIDYVSKLDNTFDLVNDTITKEWTVINSVATDIEILNSIVGVLAILLTSDQFISLNKGYDKKISRKIMMEKKQEESKYIELGKLEAQHEFNMKYYKHIDAGFVHGQDVPFPRASSVTPYNK